jgi:hypothetical protein
VCGNLEYIFMSRDYTEMLLAKPVRHVCSLKLNNIQYCSNKKST